MEDLAQAIAFLIRVVAWCMGSAGVLCTVVFVGCLVYAMREGRKNG